MEEKMKTSQNGIDLIKKFEGCRLTSYKCAAGVWTIGYGHTNGVKSGQSITQEQAESYLKEDLAAYEAKVTNYNGTYGWNQNEFDALVSFAYNVGNIDQLTANGTRSREVIAEKMLQYNKASGKVLSGLTERRTAEKELFLTAVQSKIFHVRIRNNFKKRSAAKAVKKQLKAAGFDAVVVKEVK